MVRNLMKLYHRGNGTLAETNTVSVWDGDHIVSDAPQCPVWEQLDIHVMYMYMYMLYIHMYTVHVYTHVPRQCLQTGGWCLWDGIGHRMSELEWNWDSTTCETSDLFSVAM